MPVVNKESESDSVRVKSTGLYIVTPLNQPAGVLIHVKAAHLDYFNLQASQSQKTHASSQQILVNNINRCGPEM